MLTREGEVIGVSASVYHPQDAQNLNFAIPSNALKALLAKGDGGEPSWDSRGFISAATYVQRGNAKLAARDFMGATKDFTQAVRQESANPLYYWYRGFAKGELGQHYAAIADYNKALRLNPEYAIAYHNRGYANRELRQYNAAISDYDDAIRLKPKDALIYYYRGIAKRELERFSDAEQDFRTALDLALRAGNHSVQAYINAVLG